MKDKRHYFDALVKWDFMKRKERMRISAETTDIEKIRKEWEKYGVEILEIKEMPFEKWAKGLTNW